MLYKITTVGIERHARNAANHKHCHVTAYQAKVEDLIFSAQKNTVSTITPQTGGTVDDVHRAMLVYTEQDAVNDEVVNFEYYAVMYHAAVNSLEQLKGLHHHCYMYRL